MTSPHMILEAVNLNLDTEGGANVGSAISPL